MEIRDAPLLGPRPPPRRGRSRPSWPARGRRVDAAPARGRRWPRPTSPTTSSSEWLYAAVVVVRAGTFEVIERVGVVGKATFPYVPGLLSFREAPAVLEAFAQARRPVPTCVLCDGQGVAHPRRIGLASHLGLWLDMPTIGCAKSRLCGEYEEPGPERGDRSPLVDRGEVDRRGRADPRAGPARCSSRSATAATSRAPSHVVAGTRRSSIASPCRPGWRMSDVNEIRRAVAAGPIRSVASLTSIGPIAIVRRLALRSSRLGCRPRSGYRPRVVSAGRLQRRISAAPEATSLRIETSR